MAEYSESELSMLLQKEGDKRVTEALATAKTKWAAEQEKLLAEEKAKWEQELADKAKLSAEELARKKFTEKEQAVLAKEKEIQKKTNLIDAREKFAAAEIPKEDYEPMLATLVSEDEAVSGTNVQQFIDTYNSVKSKLEVKIKSEFSKIPAPSGGGGGEITKADFQKMSYTDLVKLKKENPELYMKLLKG